MNKRRRWAFVAFGAASFVVACSSYSATKAKDGSDTTDEDSGTPVVTTMPPPPTGDGSITSNDGAPASTCPTCPSGKTCLGAGCTGFAENHCATPTVVDATIEYTVFVCATADLAKPPPSAAVDCPAFTAARPAAAFKLGAGTWQLVVRDSSAYDIGTRLTGAGVCETPTQCGEGNGPSPLDGIPGNAELAIAPQPPASGCAQIRVTWTKS